MTWILRHRYEVWVPVRDEQGLVLTWAFDSRYTNIALAAETAEYRGGELRVQPNAAVAA